MGNDGVVRGEEMDVEGIVAEYLVAHEFDGLVGWECGCGMDDLFVCSNDPGGCTPGYKWTCAGCLIGESDDGCEFSEDLDGCIRAERQVKA